LVGWDIYEYEKYNRLLKGLWEIISQIHSVDKNLCVNSMLIALT